MIELTSSMHLPSIYLDDDIHLGSLARFADYPCERNHTIHTASYIYEFAFFATTNSRAGRELTFDCEDNEMKLITYTMDNESKKPASLMHAAHQNSITIRDICGGYLRPSATTTH